MIPYRDKVVSIEEATDIVEAWKVLEEKVVFTNGCFDIVHIGHVELLEEAKRLGTKLIVAINTDESIQKSKGSDRPINSYKSRSSVIASMQAVDLVVFFGEPTPISLINLFKPDIIVKGGDYTNEDIVGYKEVLGYGGTVETIPFVDGFSTSEIIKKIKT